MENRIVIFDVETATSRPEDCIVSMGITRPGEPSREYIMKPRYPIESVGLGIHGIHNADVENCGSPKEVIMQMVADYPELAEDGTYIIGWNVEFDKNMYITEALKAGLNVPEYNWVDAMQVAQRAISKDNIGNYKLDTVYCYLNFNDIPKIRKYIDDRKTHTGSKDVEYTWEVYQQMVGDTPINEVLAEINKPRLLEKMPWGKHEGKLFKDLVNLDLQYLRWLCEQSWFVQDPKHRDLKYTLTELGLYVPKSVKSDRKQAE